MTQTKIVLIEGHPDAVLPHLCGALADAYEEGAKSAGHEVRRIRVAKIEFPLLRTQLDWEYGQVPAGLVPAQEAIARAQHLVLFFPLWLGDMPALMKGFLEQVARPGFAFQAEGRNPFAHKGLTGRSARIVVTMGMPAMVYRWYFRAHSVKALERNVLGFVGIAPVNETLIGLVDRLGEEGVRKWQDNLRRLGSRAE